MAELIAASKEGNEVEVERLLDNGADANSRDEDQSTPLHIAKNEAVTQLLLDHGADVNVRDKRQWTPLHSLLLLYRAKKVVKLLLDHGADANARGQCQFTPLHFAWNEAIVKLLVDHGADVNARDSFQETPLHKVLGNKTMPMEETLAIVKLLVDHGADVNVRDKVQWTPLHRGLHILRLYGHPFQEACNVAMARLLVNGGAQLTAFDEVGENALHRAAAHSNIELCLFYVSRGLDPNIAIEDSAETALTIYGEQEDMLPAEKKIYADQLLAAREAYEQRVRDEHWKKNWPLMNTLTSSGLRPMNAEVAALAAQQEASDKSIKLPGIPRITKAQNIAFLNQVSSSSATQSTVYGFHNPTNQHSTPTNSQLQAVFGRENENSFLRHIVEFIPRTRFEEGEGEGEGEDGEAEEEEGEVEEEEGEVEVAEES